MLLTRLGKVLKIPAILIMEIQGAKWSPQYVFSVDSFYPPQSPLAKGGSSVLPLAKGELEGVSQRTLNTYFCSLDLYQ
jgi:hypothetical protein